MRIGIIGAGFTGLSAAYELTKSGYQVTIFEKDRFAGGLASGIRQVVDDYPKSWAWDLERFYHHWFTNDEAIFNLIKELKLNDQLIIKRPLTSSWYQKKAWQLDSPLSLLKFSPLSLFDRLRTGAVLSYLKYTIKPQHTTQFENVTADLWLRKWIGERAYAVVWAPLLKGKFKEHYNQINMTWFWARIFKRTPQLAYFEGGFGHLVDLLVQRIQEMGGKFYFNSEIETIESQNARHKMQNGGLKLKTRMGHRYQEWRFDKIIITTPPMVFSKLVPNLPQDYRGKLKASPGLGALCLILVLDKPLLADGTYWLNIGEPGFPFLAVVEHTNFVDPKYYGDKHIVYVGDYLPKNHPHMEMSKEALLDKFTPYLKRINPNFQLSNHPAIQPSNGWLFRESFVQPIVRLNHVQKILPFKTPIPDLYLASMSQVYQWDRGTNYAVELGVKVARLIQGKLNNQTLV